MAPNENETLVRRFTEQVWNQRNLAVVDELVAEDGVLYDMTRGEEYVGPDNVKNYARQYLAAIPDAHVEIEELLVDGDVVVTRWTATGTHQGDLMGIPATGNDIRVSGITIDSIDGGHIVETWTILGLFELLKQLDAAPDLD